MCRFGSWYRIFPKRPSRIWSVLTWSSGTPQLCGSLGGLLSSSARGRASTLNPRLSTWSLDSALYFLIHREWLVLLCLISCSSRYSSLQTNTLAFDVLYTRHCLLLVLLLLLLLLPTIFLTVVRGQSTFSYHLFYNVRCTAHVSCLLISRMIACIRSLILRASRSLFLYSSFFV